MELDESTRGSGVSAEQGIGIGREGEGERGTHGAPGEEVPEAVHEVRAERRGVQEASVCFVYVLAVRSR